MCFSSELMPSSLSGHDVFVHSGPPFDTIVSQLLPGVSGDLDTYKDSFDYFFEGQMGTADWTHALSELPLQDVGGSYYTTEKGYIFVLSGKRRGRTQTNEILLNRLLTWRVLVEKEFPNVVLPNLSKAREGIF